MKVGINRKGYALFRLLFVIAIVGVFAAIVATGYTGYSTKAGHGDVAMGSVKSSVAVKFVNPATNPVTIAFLP
jgi:Tfp pilus assembly protein PilE